MSDLTDCRTWARNLINEQSSATGARFPSNNTLLDFFIGLALDIVVLDLANDIPESFLSVEAIALVANQNDYTLTTPWLQIWDIQKSTSGETPFPMIYLPVQDRMKAEYQGQTAGEPDYWYYLGETIYIVPTPSTSIADYCTAIVVLKDYFGGAGSDTLYVIPDIAKKLIGIMAAILGLDSYGAETGTLPAIYQKLLARVSGVLGHVVQGQARYLIGADQVLGNTRERTEYDPNWS